LSAIWALHPLLTESVTNIVGRADLLSAFGVLAALLSYSKALRSSGGRKPLWLAAIALAVAIGIFSKESAIVVLAAFILYDLILAPKLPWRDRIPGYAAASVPCLVFLLMRARVLANTPYAPFPFTDNPLIGAGFWTARFTAVKVIGAYFQLLLWPARLSADYSYNDIRLFTGRLSNWEDWKAIMALIACTTAGAIAIGSWRRNKPVFFSVAFFFATLAPTSNLIIPIGTIMAERFLYLPSVGFAACVVFVLRAVYARLPALQSAYRYGTLAAVGIILIALGFRTYDRNRDWLDEQAFWGSVVENAPGSYKGRVVAASISSLWTKEDWDRAVRNMDGALSILASWRSWDWRSSRSRRKRN
jgi:hypothetical protein